MTKNLLIAACAILLTWSVAEAQHRSSHTSEQRDLLQPTSPSISNTFAKKRKKTPKAVTPSFEVREIARNRRQHARHTSGTTAPISTPISLPPVPSTQNTTPALQKIVYASDDPLPILLEKATRGMLLPGPATRTSIVAASYEFLDEVKASMHIRQPQEEFTIRSITTDRRGQKHIRMQQHYQGVKVYGAEIVLHTQQNQLQQLNGRYQATPDLSATTPSLTGQQAIEKAISDVKKRTTFRELKASEKRLLGYEQPATELVVYRPEREASPALVWHVTLRPNFIERWEYFVDAHTGEVIDRYDHTCHVDGPRVATAEDLSGTPRQIHTYEVDGFDYLIDASRPMFNAAKSTVPDDPVGAIITLDARNSPYTDMKLYYARSQTNQWSPTAVSAHHHASVAFEYFQNTHNRNSINGQGGRILSIINVTDEDSLDFDNAVWNGAAMLYGNGSRAFSPLAGSLDVGGHEMTHGVISGTANLEYRNESGAINESMADVFAVLIERETDDWQLGEDVVNRTVFASGALRDMSDPHNGGSSLRDRGFQPKHVNEQYREEEDNGGVHINSGIANYAFYLFATNERVGLEKAERVYYQALTNYLTTSSKFIDLRIAVVQSTTDLYGADGAEVAAAKAAFDAVGIEEGEGSEERPDLPTAAGDEFILLYDVNPEDENTLYLYDPRIEDFSAKSTTTIKRKPSVTDDGSTVVFVSEDSKISTLSLVDENPNERFLQDQAIWDNVAISKDGSRIAAITTSRDTAIYVYDFGTQEWAKFRLYNPSFTEGVTTGEVLYADALEWDYSGEFLMYDAFNQFSSPDGSGLEYWDVGFMKVWDNESNTFADGEISKLFSSLPEGANIGNPSFSKNSPTIVAFDYANFEDDEFQVVGANIATGDLQVVFNNTQIGYPNYSADDKKMVFDAMNNDDEAVIAIIDLKEDKISPAESNATVFISDAKWAIWLTQGERQILSSAKEMLSFSFAEFSPVAEGVINGNSIVVTVPGNTDLTKLVASFSQSALAKVMVEGVEQQSGITANNFSEPLTYTVKAEDGSSVDYTVEVRLDQTAQLSDAKEIINFSFTRVDPPASGTISNDSVIVFVPENTNLSELAATFTLSEKAKARVGLVGQTSGVSINDFSKPVVYTIIAEDRSSQQYTVVARVDKTTDLADEVTQNAISLFPNPVAAEFTIEAADLPRRPTQIVIYNAIGKITHQQWWPHGTTSTMISVDYLSPGIYTARILLDDAYVMKRFIKQ